MSDALLSWASETFQFLHFNHLVLWNLFSSVASYSSLYCSESVTKDHVTTAQGDLNRKIILAS